jgi:hypothetical protein
MRSTRSASGTIGKSKPVAACTQARMILGHIVGRYASTTLMSPPSSGATRRRRLKDAKTHQRRTVEIVAPLAEDLAAYRPARPAPEALVVANQAGGFVDLHNWRRRVWKKAFPDSSPYDGRHSLASLLIHEGRSLPYVTAALGHSTAATTLRHYSHVYAEAQLGTGVRMADAITEARRGVRKSCAAGEPRRLRQAAPSR